MAVACQRCEVVDARRRRRGLCPTCYLLDLAEHGPTVVKVYGPTDDRFLAHVRTDGPVPDDATLGPCWTWTGSIDPRNGYGHFRVGERIVRVHRYAFERAHGPVPDGFHVDHTCHQWRTCCGVCAHRACVNPTHLRAVPSALNNARSGSPSAQNARKITCLRGHDLLDERNVYRHPQRGTRHCRVCQAERAGRASLTRAPAPGDRSA